jgi:hypothetical protein
VKFNIGYVEGICKKSGKKCCFDPNRSAVKSTIAAYSSKNKFQIESKIQHKIPLSIGIK